jgi:hypothetical protein
LAGLLFLLSATRGGSASFTLVVVDIHRAGLAIAAIGIENTSLMPLYVDNSVGMSRFKVMAPSSGRAADSHRLP